MTAPPNSGLYRPEEMKKYLDVSGMVDPDGGLVDRRVFTDKAVY